MQRTFLLTWKPSASPWAHMASYIDALAETGVAHDEWSSGGRKDLPVGSRLFLMRLGSEPKGLVGSGWCTNAPRLVGHWDPERKALGERSLMVGVDFDVLRAEPLISEAELRALSAAFPTFKSWTPQGSGVELPEALALEVERAWSGLTNSLESATATALGASPGFAEGALRTVSVNKFERNPAARRACIEHHGAACTICGFSFASAYGDDFAGFIHVHHVRPLSEIGDAYVVNPVSDLVPVCPNCHAAIHRRSPPYAPDELKTLIKRARDGQSSADL